MWLRGPNQNTPFRCCHKQTSLQQTELSNKDSFFISLGISAALSEGWILEIFYIPRFSTPFTGLHQFEYNSQMCKRLAFMKWAKDKQEQEGERITGGWGNHLTFVTVTIFYRFRRKSQCLVCISQWYPSSLEEVAFNEFTSAAISCYTSCSHHIYTHGNLRIHAKPVT